MNRDRRIEVALHAFPRRFRAVRGAELRATAADAADQGDDAYGWRALADVVVAGWRERHRTRPPLHTFVAYRSGRRLQPRWHAWMLDDVAGWLGLRLGLFTFGLMFGPIVGFWLLGAAIGETGPVWRLFAAWAALFALSPLTTGRRRREILRRHGYDPRSQTWREPRVVTAIGPRDVAPARRLLLGSGVGLAVAGTAGAVSLFAAGSMPEHVTVGAFSSTRVIDTGVLAALGALAVVLATGLGVVSFVWRHRLEARLAGPDEVTHVAPAHATDWLPGVAVALLGITGSLLPVAPLVVPVGLTIAAGAAPALIGLGIRAAAMERETGAPAWFRLGHRATSPTA
ncbi:MAG: hypothetical protein WD023_07215 [Ilumatobacteraceae bacterium]